MMDNYTVKLTRQARQQMREMAQYIAGAFQAPNSALHLIDMLEEKILSLSAFPARAPLVDEEPWHSLGIRKLSVKKYLIYFWIDEDARKVQVTAILHSMQDQSRYLGEMDLT